jgi:hypothetical protein
MPSFFEEGDQEILSHGNVLTDFFFGHVFGADGYRHARHLLQLELDGGTGVTDLGGNGDVVADNLREHADPVEGGAEDDGDLLDESVGGEENGVLFGPVLDKLLVLVELLQGVHVGHVDVQVGLLALFLVLGISNDADLEVRPGDVGKTDGSGEALILLGVVVLEANLELHGLAEANLLVGPLGLLVCLNPLNGFGNHGLRYFAGHPI